MKVTDAPQAGGIITPYPEHYSMQDRNNLPMVQRHLDVIDPKKTQTFEAVKNQMVNRRTPYAVMQTHRELAATALAAGASEKQAAMYAGISPRHVRNYKQEADFRARIAEKREWLTGRLQGKIIKELGRRLEGITDMELMDILRIYDRMTGASNKTQGVAVNVNVQQNNYENLLEQIVRVDPRSQGTDFPEYGPEDAAISAGDS